jgi:hypothetical protein
MIDGHMLLKDGGTRFVPARFATRGIKHYALFLVKSQ